MIYDISRTISTSTVVWPGDSPFSASYVYRLDEGKAVNLTTLTLSPHTGTHADATYHFESDGAFPAEMPLDPYIGPARVVTVSKSTGALTPEDFAHVDLTGVKRLLVHSPVSDISDDVWPEEFPYVSVELIEWLAGMGVVLIGLDSPSMDAFDDLTLPGHHALNQYQIVNLELLFLRDVPDGDYELIALPLKLDGVCGSPVRAILRTMES
jgi:arylformamidase